MPKPTLHIHANVDSFESPSVDNTWRKKEAKRLKAEIKVLEQKLKNLDHKEIIKQVTTSLKDDLKSKKSRLVEHKLNLA